MNGLGQLLLWGGFLSGALATVFHPPAAAVEMLKSQQAEQAVANPDFDYSQVETPVDDWSQIPWTWYSISATVCLLGVMVNRLALQSRDIDESADTTTLDELTTALAEATRATERVLAAVETRPPSQTVAAIDNEIAEHLRQFADHRNLIADRFGLAVFADVMSQFASGERAINRAWSAAADGYLDEASDCLDRGRTMLETAMTELRKTQ